MRINDISAPKRIIVVPICVTARWVYLILYSSSFIKVGADLFFCPTVAEPAIHQLGGCYSLTRRKMPLCDFVYGSGERFTTCTYISLSFLLIYCLSWCRMLALCKYELCTLLSVSSRFRRNFAFVFEGFLIHFAQFFYLLFEMHACCEISLNHLLFLLQF